MGTYANVIHKGFQSSFFHRCKPSLMPLFWVPCTLIILLSENTEFPLDAGTPIDTNWRHWLWNPHASANQPGIRADVCTSLVSIGNQGKHTPIYKMQFSWQAVPGRFCSSGHSPLEAVKPLCLPWPWLSQSSQRGDEEWEAPKETFFFFPDIKILILIAARNPSPGRPVGAAGPAVSRQLRSQTAGNLRRRWMRRMIRKMRSYSWLEGSYSSAAFWQAQINNE